MSRPSKLDQLSLDIFTTQKQARATRHYGALGKRQDRIRRYARAGLIRLCTGPRDDFFNAVLRRYLVELGGLAAPW